MRLVVHNKHADKPSDFDEAKRVVRTVLREERGGYFLWTDGRWAAATVDDIFRRANAWLKRFNRPQFTAKKEWIQ